MKKISIFCSLKIDYFQLQVLYKRISIAETKETILNLIKGHFFLNGGLHENATLVP